MRIIAFISMFFVLIASTARAQSLTDQDRASFREVISSQIEAFREDNGAKAYSYAAPSIKQIFPSPDIFMSMVRSGYMPVYRPENFEFTDVEVGSSGLPVQRVKIIGPDGLLYEAIYTMERQPDGNWQIKGCSIAKLPGLST